MKKQQLLACTMALSLFATGALRAQATTAPAASHTAPPAMASSSDSAAVAAVIERFHAAMAAGDSGTVMRLLAEDAVILESGGVETRAEYQSHHLPGDIAFVKAMTTTRGPVRVSVRGDVAWASSTSTATGESRGRRIDSAGAELMVLTRIAGEWRISAIHWSSRSRRPPA